MEDTNNFHTPIKPKNKSITLPLYSNIILTEKSKYKQKKLCRVYSLPKINENSETSGLTRVNTLNKSNAQIISVSGKKPKMKVSFAPSHKLINYIYYNPKESIFKTNDNNENEEKNQPNEQNTVCLHCTCIII